MISVWLRVIRIRFLLASIIAVSLGLAFHWHNANSLDWFSAFLTYAGVVALHASVDLLNDYWDFRRGIDSETKRTKMSGGTGVLPEGLLTPKSVYRAGIAFLILGGIIGTYFVITDGIVIAMILAFAILSIYFYSTKIVDSGLAEFFVALKGTLIVLGTFFIQSHNLNLDVLFGGLVVGVMSSLVLFISSFPDYDADKSKGRKTLVIVAGKKNASKIFWAFPVISTCIIVFGVLWNQFPTSVLISLIPLPLIMMAGNNLRQNYQETDLLVPSMSKTLMFGRLTGTLFVVGILIGM